MLSALGGADVAIRFGIARLKPKYEYLRRYLIAE